MRVKIKRMAAFLLALSMITSGSYMSAWAAELPATEQTEATALAEPEVDPAEQPTDSMTPSESDPTEQPTDSTTPSETNPTESTAQPEEKPPSQTGSEENQPTATPEAPQTSSDESPSEEEQISSQSLDEETEIVKQGKCGTNAEYVLDSNGVLTISGTGAMTNYGSSGSVPWFSNRSMITQVVIQKSVSNIGNYAFYDCTNLTSITIANSVTYIGYSAFYNCRSLTSLTIPESVTSIGNYAFQYCTGLTSITIPNSVTSIAYNAFSGCRGLTSVTIPNSVTSIDADAFYNCTGLTSVTIPESVTSIGGHAFWNCTSLTEVHITDLSKWCGISFGSLYANPLFYAKKLFLNGTQVTDLEIPDGITAIKNYAFSGCTGLTSITIPDSVTSIGKSAFSGCSKLTGVHITDLSKWCDISFGDNTANPLIYAKKLFLNGKQVTDLEIPEGMTAIKDSAFSGCTSLTSITIPESVTSIGGSAFYNCTGLTSVTIPNSVTSIGSGAFSGCSKLTGVHITDLSKWCGISFGDSTANPLTYAKKLFLNGEQVTDLEIPDGITAIKDSAFSGCTGLTSITIPDSVTSIGSSAFYNCTGLTSVTIPDSVTSIGSSAFENCTGLTGITIPNSITSIGQYAFYNCTDLTSITIPNSVTSIGGSAFRSCTGLTSVTIPNSVTSIGSYAFSGCSNLTGVHITDLSKWCAISFGNNTANPLTYAKKLFLNGKQVTDLKIPDGITAIKDSAFYNCTGLTSVTIPESVTSIGNYAFSGCTGLISITIPNSITSIGQYAFYNCTDLTSITIPNSITSIGSYAFSGCSNLTGVHITDLSKWCAISFGNNTANPLYYAKKLFLNGTQVTDLEIPDGITAIKNYAFENCTGLTSVTIPNSVTSINSSAFAGCANLTRVEFGTGLKNLYASTSNSNNPFYACNALTELVFHGAKVPYLNTSTTSSSSNSDCVKAFFSTDTMAGLKKIYVPTSSLSAYKSAWSSYLPETVKIIPYGISEDVEISLVCTSTASKHISFRWNDLEMVDSYEVYRDEKKIATTTETSYTDSDIEAGSSHNYAVVAVQGEIRTTPKEFTFTTVMPTVSSVGGGVDNWMNGKHNVLQATVPNQNNLEGAVGVFTVNGKTLEATAKTSGSNAIYSAEWDISSKTVPAGTYTVNFTLTDADGATASKEEQMTVDYTVPNAISGVIPIGDTQKIVLSWNISTEIITTTYLVYRADDDNGDYSLVKIIDDRNTLSFTDYNVEDGHTYHYYVLGKNKLGVVGSAEKAMRVSAVAQSDTELPTISSLTPKNDTRVHGNVNIKATSADNAGVKRTELYYAVAGDHAASEINEWTLLNKQNASVCTAVFDTSKLADGNVYIKAVAYDTSNNSSNPTYRTLVVDNTGPDKVHDFTIKTDEKTQKQLLTATSVTLTWSDLDDAITNNHDRVGFVVEQKNNNTFTEVKRVNTIGAEIEGLSPQTEYVFRVRGYDDLGNLGTPSNELTVTTLGDKTAPVVTEILPDSATYGDSLPLKVTAEDNSGVDRVTVIYSTDGKKTWQEYGENITFDGTKSKVTASMNVNLRSFAEGKVCFGAIAYDTANNASGMLTGYTNPYVEYNIDHTAPAEPKNFVANAQLGKVVLVWTQGSETDLKGYNIYRSTSADDETFTKIAGPVSTISYHDTAITADTTYWYKISAVDKVGNESVITKAVSVTAQVDNEAPTIAAYSPKSDYLGGSSVRFGVNAKDNWKVSKVKIQYQVNDGELKNGSDANFSASSVTASATVSLEKLKDGDILKFIVTVTDAQGLTAEKTYPYTIDKTAPTITELSSRGNNGTSITLSWQTGGERDLDGYYIYRIDPNGSTSCIAKVTDGSYTDKNILPRTVYGYRVTAVDQYGNSSSAELTNVRSAPVYAVLNCDAALSVGAQYAFDAGESTAAAGIETYSFDFGDGTPAESGSAKSMIHAYAAEGTYTVKLTVTDTDGNTDTVERQVVAAKPTTIGKTTIKVVNAENNPLVGAKVYFDYDKGLDNCKTTNNSGKATFSAESGRYVIGVYYNSEYLPVKKTVSVLPKTESTVTIVLSEQEIVTGEFAVNRVPLEELEEKYKIDPTVAANRDFVEVNVNMVFGEQQVSMVVVSDGWENFNYNEVKQYFVNDRVLTPVYIPIISSDDNNSQSAAPNPGFVAVLDVPVNATYTKEFFDVKLYIMNNASEEFTMVNNQVTLNVQNDDRDGETSSTDPSTGLVLIESPATCSSKSVTFGDLKGQETQKLEWLFRGDVEGYYNLTADYNGLLKEFNENISATFKTNNPIHVYGASALNLDVDIKGNTKGGTVDFTLGLRNITPDYTVNMPTLDIAGNIIEASKCLPENSGELTFLETWEKGAEITREYIKKADGTKVDVESVSELKPGETYCKDYRINIGSDMLTYAKNLQAVIKEIGEEHSIKTNIYVDGVEAEHKFLNYYSDKNATCFADGTKTAKCENGCGATKTVTDLGSKDKVKHHFVDGVCVNDGCGKQMQVKVAFISRLGSVIRTPEIYPYETAAQNIAIETAAIYSGYDYKGWTLDGKLYTEDSALQEAIYAAFHKEYSIAGDTVTISPQATYEKSVNTKHTVTVSGGTLKDGSTSGTFEMDEEVYVYAGEAPAGKFFDHWECNGAKVSNARTYIFFMPSDNVTLKAVYAEEEKEELGTISIERVTAYANQKQLTFVHTYAVPLGSGNVTAGVLATCHESDKDLLELGKLPSCDGNYTKKQSVSVTNYRYTWTKGNVTSDQVWYVRAYLTYTDPKGKKQTIYGKRIRTTLNGGGYTTDE